MHLFYPHPEERNFMPMPPQWFTNFHRQTNGVRLVGCTLSISPHCPVPAAHVDSINCLNTPFGYMVLAGMSYVRHLNGSGRRCSCNWNCIYIHRSRENPNFDLVFEQICRKEDHSITTNNICDRIKNNIPIIMSLDTIWCRICEGKQMIHWSGTKWQLRAWNVPFIPFRFFSALKKETGLYVKDLYKEMSSLFKKNIKAQLIHWSRLRFEKINPRTSKAYYTDYMFPSRVRGWQHRLARKSGIVILKRW